MDSSGAPSLGDLMEDRRLELDMDWQEVAELVGISRQALLDIRNGTTPRPKTARGIDRALQWRPGSVQKYLQDKTPPVIEAAVHQPEQNQQRATEHEEMVNTIEAYLRLLGQGGRREVVVRALRDAADRYTASSEGGTGGEGVGLSG